MMKIELPRRPIDITTAAAILGLALTSAGLSLALWARASVRPEVVEIDGPAGPRRLAVGRVPDALARDFARDYLVAFETFSPSTIEAASAFSRSRVSPSMLGEFNRLLENRKKIALESGMVSQILLEDPLTAGVTREGTRLEVLLHATRRVYVADKLAQEARLLYRIAVEPGEPTRENPTGLLVAGQSVRIQPQTRDTHPTEEREPDGPK